MIFRRRQDEMEGFRRMREALRQQTDPKDQSLLDEQYGDYDDEDETDDADELAEVDDELTEVSQTGEYQTYAEDTAASQRQEPIRAGAAAPTAAPAEAQYLAPSPPAGPSMTTIGADTSWTGTLRSESNIYLEGRIEGTLEARDTIYIAERATIDAKLKANSVVVSGQVTGHIDCDGRLEMTPTGRLNGEAEVGSLVVHEGAILDGKVRMKSGAAAKSGQ